MTGAKAARAFLKAFLFRVSVGSILAILAGILLNIGGQRFADWVQPPFWLDTIGTMVVAILYGPLAGIIVGAATTAFLAIFDSYIFTYIGVAIAVGVIVGFFFVGYASGKKKRDPFDIISIGILTAIVTSLASIPLDIVNFDGHTGNIWGDAFYDMISGQVNSTFFSALASKLFLELPDKVISLLIAVLIVKLVKRIVASRRDRFEKGAGSGRGAGTGRGTGTGKGSGAGQSEGSGMGPEGDRRTSKRVRRTALLLAFSLGASLLSATIPGSPAHAEQLNAEFETVVYGRGKGMLSSEINAVAQTRDGYLWVGTYSGLYRYDGVRFEPVESNGLIKNVMTLFVDSKDRLWVGTNDSGAICNDHKTATTVLYNALSGLTADTIRQFCEDKDGNIYIATSRYVSRISPDGAMKTYNTWDDIFYVQDLVALPTGEVVGVTNSGTLFMLKNDLLLDTLDHTDIQHLSYRSVAYSSKTDSLLVGTDDLAYQYIKVEDGKFVPGTTRYLPNNSYFNDIAYDADYGGYFICCENGMGFLNETTENFTEMTNAEVKGAISSVCVDDQKNIWFASNKYGLAKYSRSPFLNPLSRSGLETSVANALYKDGHILYMGTDTGLTTLNLDTNMATLLPYAGSLKGVRIRNIMKDSKGNLWYSTYGKDGLVKVDPEGNIKTFNEDNSGMLGGRARCTIELSDGRILVASNTGLSFIKDDVVVATIGVDNGLENQYILFMYEREDGSILAASDGDGIYIIKDDRVIGHIGKDEGLQTAVVLKIIKCTGGFLYVTSNSLYYDNGTTIRQLSHFPYSNNYDILITEDRLCWITSSAGLYIVSEDALLADEEYTCTLLNESWGLTTTFTANSYNVLEDGMLYLCCTNGVRILSTTSYDHLATEFRMHISSIERGEETFVEKEGKYVIPAGSGRVTFNVAINNYSLSNPMVHYYLEGSNDEGITCFQDEIQPLSFTNLAHGDYKFHIEIIDGSTGEIRKEEVYDVTKESRMYERLYFQIYLYIVSALLMMYIIWLFVTINRKTSRIMGLQKEISTDKMTGLMNKAGATRALEKLCAEEAGTFLMIDLDSFKLVNDIYGHDMGDRILIRFAELIREALGEENLAGRMGGDEFVGFVKHELDEDRIAEITRFLNRELVKSAKEYMGEDMEIPLGTSIGAVRVPIEGTDFHEIFKYADKALYNVKQNGKHGYSFYQRSAGEKEQEERRERSDLSEIKKIIGERNEGKGAYLVNFDRLQALYKYISRNDHAMNSQSGFLRISVDAKDGGSVPDEVLDSLEDLLVTGFRKNDALTRYSGSFYLLCTGASAENSEVRANEVIEKWKDSGEFEDYVVVLDVETVGGE